jgi:hypothetical protein
VFAHIYAAATGSATGNQSVVISWTGTTRCWAIAVSASGVDQTTPLINGTSENLGNGATPSLAITSSTSDLSVDVVGTYDVAPSSPTQTSIYAGSQSGDIGLGASRATTPAASVTHAWAAHGWQSHAGADFLAYSAPPAGGGSVLTLSGVGK